VAKWKRRVLRKTISQEKANARAYLLQEGRKAGKRKINLKGGVYTGEKKILPRTGANGGGSSATLTSKKGIRLGCSIKFRKRGKNLGELRLLR